MLRRLVSCAVILGLAASFASTAAAQRVTDPPLAPGLSLAAPDEVIAIESNPAALAFLDAWELAYFHAEALRNGSTFDGEGDSLYVGAPLFFGIAAGLAVHSIRPENGSGLSDRGMATLTLAHSSSRSFGAGMALHYVGSSDPTLDGVFGVDVSTSWRPSQALALSFFARDLTGLFDLSGIGGGRELPASFGVAAALRPFGRRALTFDAAGFVDTDGAVRLRGALEVGIPYVGRALAAAEVRHVEEDPELLVSAGLEVAFQNYSVSGGVLAGDGFDGSAGFYAGARMGGTARQGIPSGSYVAEMEVAGLDPRGMIALSLELDRVLHDDRVAGVYLRMGSTGIGLAYAQELRWMIAALRRSGKPVVCHVEDASGSEFYACAAANAIYADPAGGVRLMGPASNTILLGDLLRRIGLRAEFIRIGRYKSAAEQFTNRIPSQASREQQGALLDDVYSRLATDLSVDLGVSPEEVRAMVDRGPFVSAEAVDEGIVEGESDRTEMDEHLRDAFEGSYARVTSRPREESTSFGQGPRIGVVLVDGDIVDGENVDVPFLGVHMSGGRTVSEAIDAMAAEPTVAAIVLRIDSPGGSVLASDQIWRAVRRARRRKPVIASMGTVAASGGYYIAAAADEIWADPSTITGSIGVFFGKVDVLGLAAMIGVTIETNRRGLHAGAESLYQPLSAADRAMLADKVRFWYRRFLARIADGRGVDVVATDRVARGRVWSGDRALRHGLVDRLGGFGAALARARSLTNLPVDAEVALLPAGPGGLLDLVFGGGSHAEVEGALAPEAAEARRIIDAVPPELQASLRTLVSLAYVREGVPLARMEEIVEIH